MYLLLRPRNGTTKSGPPLPDSLNDSSTSRSVVVDSSGFSLPSPPVSSPSSAGSSGSSGSPGFFSFFGFGGFHLSFFASHQPSQSAIAKPKKLFVSFSRASL